MDAKYAHAYPPSCAHKTVLTKRWLKFCVHRRRNAAKNARGKKKRARKLSVRTNESSPFARLSPTNGTPHAATLPSHHQSSTGLKWQNLECVCFLMHVCLCVCASWTPPGETSSCVCHSNPPFFPSVRVTDCNAHERKQAFESLSCICPCAYTLTLCREKHHQGQSMVDVSSLARITTS